MYPWPVKPNDFFMGIVDVFAMLLPGGMCVFVLHPLIGPYVMSEIAAFGNESAPWLFFLIGAYFLGHLVFHAGSFLDPLYHQVRMRLHPYDHESPYAAATEISARYLSEREIKATNTYQWSRSILTSLFPTAASEVQRLEADSKFFRSLIIVLVLAGCVYLARGLATHALVAFLLVGPCALRYYERRLKCTRLAYQAIVTYYRLGRLGEPMAEVRRSRQRGRKKAASAVQEAQH